MLTRRSRARGFTLLEVVLALAVLGVVAAALLASMVPEQRLLRALDDLVAARRTLNDAAHVLRYDLRSLTSAGDGIYDAADDRVEFRAVLGASVVCAIDSARTAVSLAPLVPDAPSLAAWVTSPVAGDTVLLYADADTGSSRWSAHEIASPPGPGMPCPESLGLTPGAARPVPSVAMRVATPIGSGVGPGAAVRIVRRARYAAYRAADGKWYLGYTDCLASRAVPCAVIQPVAGPFEPGGVSIEYRNSTGAVAASPAQTAWIDVVMRPIARDSMVVGLPHGALAESLRVTIAVRN